MPRPPLISANLSQLSEMMMQASARGLQDLSLDDFAGDTETVDAVEVVWE